MSNSRRSKSERRKEGECEKRKNKFGNEAVVKEGSKKRVNEWGRSAELPVIIVFL